MVIRRSMKVRYFIEMFFFFSLAVAFQYELAQLAKAFHTVTNEFYKLDAVQAEIADGTATEEEA